MKLIVLDRDGVINQQMDGPVASPDDWTALPGSIDAIAQLHQAGYRVAVFTNQSGISRGTIALEALHEIHRKMIEQVSHAGGRIDVVVFCPHSDVERCDCRKPMPGMLYTISERLEIDLSTVTVVGDSLRDLQAAMATGASPVLVRTGNGIRTLDDNKGLEHIPAYDDLAHFVTSLLSEERRAQEERKAPDSGKPADERKAADTRKTPEARKTADSRKTTDGKKAADRKAADSRKSSE